MKRSILREISLTELPIICTFTVITFLNRIMSQIRPVSFIVRVVFSWCATFVENLETCLIVRENSDPVKIEFHASNLQMKQESVSFLKKIQIIKIKVETTFYWIPCQRENKESDKQYTIRRSYSFTCLQRLMTVSSDWLVSTLQKLNLFTLIIIWTLTIFLFRSCSNRTF